MLVMMEERMKRSAFLRSHCLALIAVLLAAAAALVVGSAPVALAQEWPTRPVKIVVPYGAGGLGDVQARLTAEHLSKVIGETVLVENRPGAGGTTAIQSVIRAPKDGYTLLFIAGLHFTMLPLMQKLSYDPFNDLEPILISGRWGMVYGVNIDSPVNSLRDLIDYARANPGKVDYSTAGPGGANHLAAAALAGHEKLDMVHVPFGSGPASLMAVMSKQVFLHAGNPTDMIEATLARKIKALAVSTPQRMPQLPDVPTASETIPGFELVFWVGFVAAKGTPHAVIDRASKALAEVARDPDMAKRLRDLGIESTAIMPAEFLETARREKPFYENLADKAGLRRQ
jgi:tripartite-type tricarboxylate transporter receptor subunit TctC